MENVVASQRIQNSNMQIIKTDSLVQTLALNIFRKLPLVFQNVLDNINRHTASIWPHWLCYILYELANLIKVPHLYSLFTFEPWTRIFTLWNCFLTTYLLKVPPSSVLCFYFRTQKKDILCETVEQLFDHILIKLHMPLPTDSPDFFLTL
jgi:hypothetical protein